MVKKKKDLLVKIKSSVLVTTKEYVQTLADLKKQVQGAQIKAALSANKELLKLYWSIGKTITEKQEKSGWGTGVIENFAKDLQSAFPGVEGFSVRNMFRMRAFYREYQIVTQPVSQFEDLPIFRIPWGHNILLFQRIKNNTERLWYAAKAIENGWSRTILEMQIESNLYGRTGKAITNFKKTLPTPHSDMAQQSLKDPYLFYHTKLRCYVVVELKTTAFKPEYAGKFNFYLSAVDDLLRHPDDKPTIGLLLCKTKDNFIAEYALRDINKPIGVAEYTTKLVEKLPKNLKGSLPTIEEIEAELEKHEALSALKRRNMKQKRKKQEIG